MITGTGDAMIFSMMSRVESTSPPGVLISISTAWSWLAAADWRARSMYSAVMGWIASLTTILRTSAEAEEDRAKTMSSNRSVRMGSAAAGRFNSIALSYAPSGLPPFLLTPLRGLYSCAASRLGGGFRFEFLSEGGPSLGTAFSGGDGFVFRALSFGPSGQLVAAGDQAGAALVG